MHPVSRRLVLSCEHASAAVPRAYAGLFRGAESVLASHRGWDIGAAPVARMLARALGAPLVEGRTTRLLIDLNRSRHNRTLFSEWTRALPCEERAALVAHHHAPHWQRLEQLVEAAETPVVHVAVHSFTPVLRGRVRELELGLLYDPRRPRERRFADRIHAAVERQAPALRIRRNAPYRGTSDALPTAFRKTRRPADYLGLELELNQATLATARDRSAWGKLLATAVCEALAAEAGSSRKGGARTKR